MKPIMFENQMKKKSAGDEGETSGRHLPVEVAAGDVAAREVVGESPPSASCSARAAFAARCRSSPDRQHGGEEQVEDALLIDMSTPAMWMLIQGSRKNRSAAGRPSFLPALPKKIRSR